MKKLTFTFKKNGTFEQEAEGFAGHECLAKAALFYKGLGANVDQAEPKAEMNQTSDVEN